MCAPILFHRELVGVLGIGSGGLWAGLGRSREDPGESRGGPGGIPGGSRESPGGILGPPGGFLGGLGKIPEKLEGVLEAPGSFLGESWESWGRPGSVLGGLADVRNGENCGWDAAKRAPTGHSVEVAADNRR